MNEGDKDEEIDDSSGESDEEIIDPFGDSEINNNDPFEVDGADLFSNDEGEDSDDFYKNNTFAEDDEGWMDDSAISEEFFESRRNQLQNASDEQYPDAMPFFSELIQNSDDANSEEMCIIFTDSALYVSNNGTPFNKGARMVDGKSVGGDLEIKWIK